MEQVATKAVEVVVHFPSTTAVVLTVLGIGFACVIALFAAHAVGRKGFDSEDD